MMRLPPIGHAALSYITVAFLANLNSAAVRCLPTLVQARIAARHEMEANRKLGSVTSIVLLACGKMALVRFGRKGSCIKQWVLGAFDGKFKGNDTLIAEVLDAKRRAILIDVWHQINVETPCYGAEHAEAMAAFSAAHRIMIDDANKQLTP